MNDRIEKSGSQRDRFIKTARSLGADEDEAAFKAQLGVIARQKPKETGRKPSASQKDE